MEFNWDYEKRINRELAALKSWKWIPVKSHLYLRDAVMAFKSMTGLSPEVTSLSLGVALVVERPVIHKN